MRIVSDIPLRSNEEKAARGTLGNACDKYEPKEIGLIVRIRMASPTLLSWNRIVGWLKELDSLRRVAA